ncbi:hypothetical protein N7501_006724 [Penicillium viridicatum]|nr:hypothetical protein N7501_006724 [Penicillium viridicatum]
MGFVFHYYCWEILGHLVGKELIEKTLGQVVQAAWQYWQPHKKGWGVTDIDTIYRAQLDEVPYVKCESYVPGCDIFVNPWITPELQSIIQLAQNARAPISIDFHLKSPFWWRKSFALSSTLNPMCRMCVTCYPYAFWRSRLQSKRDLFFEVDLPETDSVDWQLLWLGLMDLLSDKWYTSSGLAHREKVLGPIREIIAIFQEIR